MCYRHVITDNNNVSHGVFLCNSLTSVMVGSFHIYSLTSCHMFVHGTKFILCFTPSLMVNISDYSQLWCLLLICIVTVFDLIMHWWFVFLMLNQFLISVPLFCENEIPATCPLAEHIYPPVPLEWKNVVLLLCYVICFLISRGKLDHTWPNPEHKIFERLSTANFQNGPGAVTFGDGGSK